VEYGGGVHARVLVSLVKLSTLRASSRTWPSGRSGGSPSLTAAAYLPDPREIWAWAHKFARSGDDRMTGKASTAAEFGLISCHACGLASRPARAEGSAPSALRRQASSSQTGQCCALLGISAWWVHPVPSRQSPADHGDEHAVRYSGRTLS
jgi:hypothetical protein